MTSLAPFSVSPADAGATLAAVLRRRLPGLSWEQVRRMIAARRARINGELALDPARRLKEAETVELLAHSLPPPRQPEAVTLRHLDEHIAVVEKPSGLSTVRHPAEREWTEERRKLSLTLEDIVPRLIAEQQGSKQGGKQGSKPHGPRGPRSRLRIVHRLDKETSGLLVFARTVEAERDLGRQFHRHSVVRRYLAIVPGKVAGQTVRSRLVRDRGDGRRGSTPLPDQGKLAVTHLDVVEALPAHTLVSCRLETGRTHQIRIHLAELGHPVCGEKVYGRRSGEPPRAEAVPAPRLALHATELGFVHPGTGEEVHWTMPLPEDLQLFLRRLRTLPAGTAGGRSG